MKKIELAIDLVNPERTYGCAETPEKVLKNLRHFPGAMQGILKHKLQEKEDTIAAWVAGRWIVYYLFEMTKNEESIYFFDLNFNFDTLSGWPTNSVVALKHQQARYKNQFSPDKDRFELAKYDATVLN